jgi:hypothetical protein
LRKKLFPAGLDVFAIFLQLFGDVCHAAQVSKMRDDEHRHMRGSDTERGLISGELRFLDVRQWSPDLRLVSLQVMERLLLRTLISSHPSSSFSSLLMNHLSTHTHPGDVGITSACRSSSHLWRFYFILEMAQISSSPSDTSTTLSRHVHNEEIIKRLTLLFRGNELISSGSEEILAARDVSVLQGSLRAKELWMESFFGQLVLLHYRLEKMKKKKKQQQHQEEQRGEAGGVEEHDRENEEEEYVMTQILQAMERREIMCRIMA